MPSSLVKNNNLSKRLTVTNPKLFLSTLASYLEYDSFRCTIPGLPERTNFSFSSDDEGKKMREDAVKYFLQENNLENIEWKNGDLYDPTVPVPPVAPVVGLAGLSAAPNPVTPPGNYGNPGSFQRKVWISMWLLHDCTGFT